MHHILKIFCHSIAFWAIIGCAVAKSANRELLVVGMLKIIGETKTGDEIFLRDLEKFCDDEEIKSLIIRIDSPGGPASSSPPIISEVLLCKNKKPVITFTENICASAAYAIATATDAIVATPMAFVGSVGAFQEIAHLENIVTRDADKGTERIAKFVVLSTDVDNMLKHRLTDEHVSFERKNEYLDSSGNEFKQSILRNRPALLDRPFEEWGDGKLFSGRRAYDIGLVDKLGSYSDALELIVHLLNKRGTPATIDQLVIKLADKKQADQNN